MKSPNLPIGLTDNRQLQTAHSAFADRLRTAVSLALPCEYQTIAGISRAMGEASPDRFDAVFDGELLPEEAEIDRLAGMMGVSDRWLKTGAGHPFRVYSDNFSDSPLGFVSMLAQKDRGPADFGAPLGLTFVACDFPAYGPPLVLRQYAATSLTPLRFDVVSMSGHLAPPDEDEWCPEPACLVTHLAFLANLRVGRGGYRGQGVSSIIVSDDTYDALRHGNAHILNLPVLIENSTWHLDLFDRDRLTDPAWTFINWKDWQPYGLWALADIARRPKEKARFDAYCRGDHPDFTTALDRLDAAHRRRNDILTGLPVSHRDNVSFGTVGVPPMVC